MKKILITLSVIVFLGFLALGWIGLSFDEERVYTVKNTPDDIYSYLTDLSYYPQWYNGFIRHELINGEFRTEDSQYMLLVQDEGEPFEIIETIVELDSPVLFHKEHQHDFYNLDIQIKISQQTQHSSEVVIHQKLYGTRFMERILMPLYADQVMEEHFKNYQDAFQILENKQ